MKWEKFYIINQQGDSVQAQSPVIVSASRATDIPAFYSNWFINRLQDGYVKWINPFNGVPLYVSFRDTRLVVFWTKNPKPLMKHLDYINEKIPNYYFQYTLNDYDVEKLEPSVLDVKRRVDTFVELSDKIGKEKIIWRFDPLMLTDKIGVDELLRKTENVGNQLKGYTDKMIFSFADIKNYKKVQYNLQKNNVNYVEFDEEKMNQYASGLQELNKNWGFEIGTCAEKIPLEQYGIKHNKCIDDDLMIKLFKHDEKLMEFLGVKIIPNNFSREDIIKKTRDNKDKGQRELCGCIMSKDIGEYNTCPHGCKYCYANTTKEIALLNWKNHDPKGETIKGT